MKRRTFAYQDIDEMVNFHHLRTLFIKIEKKNGKCKFLYDQLFLCCVPLAAVPKAVSVPLPPGIVYSYSAIRTIRYIPTQRAVISLMFCQNELDFSRSSGITDTVAI